jgi:ATP-dependent 26S proteasome regulatory subunit
MVRCLEFNKQAEGREGDQTGEEVYTPLTSPHGYTLAAAKAIVFVTGVPGAGKTLAGLNVATRHDEGQVTLLAAI